MPSPQLISYRDSAGEPHFSLPLHPRGDVGRILRYSSSPSSLRAHSRPGQRPPAHLRRPPARLPPGVRQHRPSQPLNSRAFLKKKKKTQIKTKTPKTKQQKPHKPFPPIQRCFFQGKKSKTKPQTPARCCWLRSPAGTPRCPRLGESRCSALPPPQARPPAPGSGTLRVIPAPRPAPPPRAAVGCRFPFHLEIFSGGGSRLVISARRKRHRRGSRGREEPRDLAGRAGHSRAQPSQPPAPPPLGN